MGSGVTTYRGTLLDFYSYGEMKIYFSKEGRVIAIKDGW